MLKATVDGGRTWRSVAVPKTVTDLRRVVFASTNVGWILGDQLMATSDGGASWATVALPGTANNEVLSAATNGDAVVVAAVTENGNVTLFSSPVERQHFTATDVAMPVGAGPAPTVALSLGRVHGLAVVTNRAFVDAAEIDASGNWQRWEPGCPRQTPLIDAALSPSGASLTIACGASGWGDAAPLLAADLSTGRARYVALPDGQPTADGQSAQLGWVAATDGGTRLVGYTTALGEELIAASSDAGATWKVVHRRPRADGQPTIAHIPTGSLLVSGPQPGQGLISSDDGLTWTEIGG